mmetsp:Transcript_42773/g.67015  ORF Transcript_42773/g.67015 Transcript_42773/m.67015 type:complete len:528 (-) Transcript_42773:846-2429(-)
MVMGLGRLRGVLIGVLLVSGAQAFKPQKQKVNQDLDDFEGKTAWIQDFQNEETGSLSQGMCVDYASGVMVEAIYDNPGQCHQNPKSCTPIPHLNPNATIPNTSGRIKLWKDLESQKEVYESSELVLPDLPYPGKMVCDGAGIAFVASTTKPSAVVAVSASASEMIYQKSTVVPIPEACGGIQYMVYSIDHKMLIGSCGAGAASLIPISVVTQNDGSLSLTVREMVLIDGPAMRGPRGLALVEPAGKPHFLLVGVTGGTLVQMSLPNLTVVAKRATGAQRLSEFAVGDNGRKIIMFSPFPWRRMLVMETPIDSNLADKEIFSVALDQDMEWIVDMRVDPTSSMAFIIGNSARKLPAVLQVDTNDPYNTWGIILAGLCDRKSAKGVNDWCEWGPKGRFAQSVTTDFHPTRSQRLYMAVTTQYCVHCADWQSEDSLRCKAGKEAEDYYDDGTYCLQEEWNKRQLVFSGEFTAGELDMLTEQAYGGNNASVVVMQVGEIPLVGGVAAGSCLASSTLLAIVSAAVASFLSLH